MRHLEAQVDAAAKTMSHNERATCGVFDDKLNRMGEIVVTRGKMTISLDYIPSMVGDNSTQDFLCDTLRASILAVVDRHLSLLDPHNS